MDLRVCNEIFEKFKADSDVSFDCIKLDTYQFTNRKGRTLDSELFKDQNVIVHGRGQINHTDDVYEIAAGCNQVDIFKTIKKAKYKTFEFYKNLMRPMVFSKYNSDAIDLNVILSFPDLDWDFDALSEHPDLTESIIEELDDRPWNWFKLCKRDNLSMEFLINNAPVNKNQYSDHDRFVDYLTLKQQTPKTSSSDKGNFFLNFVHEYQDHSYPNRSTKSKADILVFFDHMFYKYYNYEYSQTDVKQKLSFLIQLKEIEDSLLFEYLLKYNILNDAVLKSLESLPDSSSESVGNRGPQQVAPTGIRSDNVNTSLKIMEQTRDAAKYQKENNTLKKLIEFFDTSSAKDAIQHFNRHIQDIINHTVSVGGCRDRLDTTIRELNEIYEFVPRFKTYVRNNLKHLAALNSHIHDHQNATEEKYCTVESLMYRFLDYKSLGTASDFELVREYLNLPFRFSTFLVNSQIDIEQLLSTFIFPNLLTFETFQLEDLSGYLSSFPEVCTQVCTYLVFSSELLDREKQILLKYFMLPNDSFSLDLYKEVLEVPRLDTTEFVKKVTRNFLIKFAGGEKNIVKFLRKYLKKPEYKFDCKYLSKYFVYDQKKDIDDNLDLSKPNRRLYPLNIVRDNIDLDWDFKLLSCHPYVHTLIQRAPDKDYDWETLMCLISEYPENNFDEETRRIIATKNI
jgi:hypothetical protein